MIAAAAYDDVDVGMDDDFTAGCGGSTMGVGIPPAQLSMVRRKAFDSEGVRRIVMGPLEGWCVVEEEVGAVVVVAAVAADAAGGVGAVVSSLMPTSPDVVVG